MVRVVNYVESLTEVFNMQEQVKKTYAMMNIQYKFDFGLTVHEGEIHYRVLIEVYGGTEKEKGRL